MNQFRIIAYAVLLTLSACTTSPERTLAKPATNSTGLIQARLERIQTTVDKAIAAGEIPGAVALIIKNGKTVYHQAFGLADIASQKPMNTGAIFRLASMTKAITSTAVMMLHEQGLFKLIDPISKFLPEFSSMRIVDEVAKDGSIVSTTPATKPILIIDLLMHTSGISYSFIPGPLNKPYLDAGVSDGITASDLTLETNIRRLSEQPLLFEPGSKWEYGLSTDVLGRLIEVVSGQSLDKYLAQNITGPLGMKDTEFYLPDSKADRLVTLYAHVDGKGLIESDGSESNLKLDNPDYPIEGAKSFFSGGGGLSGTAADYGRFLHMLLNQGELDGVRILSRKSVELMRTARINRESGNAPDFGLGFSVISDLGTHHTLGSPGSYAWGGAFYTSYWIDPSEQLAAVFMSQTRPSNSDIADKFKTLVYQALQ